jgi:hypothetical protein
VQRVVKQRREKESKEEIFRCIFVVRAAASMISATSTARWYQWLIGFKGSANTDEKSMRLSSSASSSPTIPL